MNNNFQPQTVGSVKTTSRTEQTIVYVTSTCNGSSTFNTQNSVVYTLTTSRQCSVLARLASCYVLLVLAVLPRPTSCVSFRCIFSHTDSSVISDSAPWPSIVCLKAFLLLALLLLCGFLSILVSCAGGVVPSCTLLYFTLGGIDNG